MSPRFPELMPNDHDKDARSLSDLDAVVLLGMTSFYPNPARVAAQDETAGPGSQIKPVSVPEPIGDSVPFDLLSASMSRLEELGLIEFAVRSSGHPGYELSAKAMKVAAFLRERTIRRAAYRGAVQLSAGEETHAAVECARLVLGWSVDPDLAWREVFGAHRGEPKEAKIVADLIEAKLDATHRDVNLDALGIEVGLLRVLRDTSTSLIGHSLLFNWVGCGAPDWPSSLRETRPIAPLLIEAAPDAPALPDTLVEIIDDINLSLGVSTSRRWAESGDRRKAFHWLKASVSKSDDWESPVIHRRREINALIQCYVATSLRGSLSPSVLSGANLFRAVRELMDNPPTGYGSPF